MFEEFENDPLLPTISFWKIEVGLLFLLMVPICFMPLFSWALKLITPSYSSV